MQNYSLLYAEDKYDMSHTRRRMIIFDLPYAPIWSVFDRTLKWDGKTAVFLGGRYGFYAVIGYG
jgi:hypothetical protein